MAFALQVMDFIRQFLSEIQEDNRDLYNLEATPAEGTSYRLAMIDKKEFQRFCAPTSVNTSGERLPSTPTPPNFR